MKTRAMRTTNKHRIFDKKNKSKLTHGVLGKRLNIIHDHGCVLKTDKTDSILFEAVNYSILILSFLFISFLSINKLIDKINSGEVFYAGVAFLLTVGSVIACIILINIFWSLLKERSTW